MKRLPLRVALPILAAVSFVLLSLATARQTYIVDLEGWGHFSSTEVHFGPEPVDIGTPADVLLLALDLPALIALIPLLPLTYWVESETVLRTAWGLAAVGQWFLIGRCFDARRRLLPAVEPSRPVLLNKLLFGITMVAGAPVAVVGVFRAASGHHSVWGFVIDASFAVWGSILVAGALRWRSSSSWVREDSNSLRLS